MILKDFTIPDRKEALKTRTVMSLKENFGTSSKRPFLAKDSTIWPFTAKPDQKEHYNQTSSAQQDPAWSEAVYDIYSFAKAG